MKPESKDTSLVIVLIVKHDKIVAIINNNLLIKKKVTNNQELFDKSFVGFDKIVKQENVISIEQTIYCTTERQHTITSSITEIIGFGS